jgi:hypothetical protein
MAKDYKIVFSIYPMPSQFYFHCKADTKEQASHKAEVEIQKAVNTIHKALKPFEMEPKSGISAELLFAEHLVDGLKHQDDVRVAIEPNK